MSTTSESSSFAARSTKPVVTGLRKSRWKLWLAIAGGLLVLLILVVAMIVRNRSSTASAASATALAPFEVKRGRVEQSVDSSGSVAANLEVEIKCRASGEVVELPFDISDHVKKGALLCKLDPRDEQLRVRTAEQDLAQAKARLSQAQSVYEQAKLNLVTTRQKYQANLVSAQVKYDTARAKTDRVKQLTEQNLGSREEFETAQSSAASALSDLEGAKVAVEELDQQEKAVESKQHDVTIAQSSVETSQIALDTANQNLAYTTVTAPIDGTVSDLKVQKGTIVASGTNAVNGGTTIMTLSDLSHVYFMATVDEADIGHVEVGQKARITLSSYGMRTFEGVVRRVPVKGKSESNVVTFEVKIEVTDEAKNLFKPIMTGNATIIQDQRENALMVPKGAIKRENNQSMVTLTDGQSKEVKTGLESSEMVEILEGVKEGDKVQVSAIEPSTKWKNDDRRGPPH